MVSPLQVAVLADTHIAAGKTLPEVVWHHLSRADVVLHAGDLTSACLLEELAGSNLVHAVLGNNDSALAAQLPERIETELAGVRVAMVHDSGQRSGRAERLHRWFPSASLVVFGHSHEPIDELGIGGQRIFNPGSPTQRRRQPNHTMGWLQLQGGHILTHEIIVIPPPLPRRDPVRSAQSLSVVSSKRPRPAAAVEVFGES